MSDKCPKCKAEHPTAAVEALGLQVVLLGDPDPHMACVGMTHLAFARQAAQWMIETCCLRCRLAAVTAERDALQTIADRLLEHTEDGVPFVPYDPRMNNPPMWAVWRYCEEDEPARVSPCHAPQTPDEVNTDFDIIIDDAEDISQLLGVYSTRELAEAAKEQP